MRFTANREWKASAPWQAALGIVLLVAVVWAAVYLTSDGFQERVRLRVVGTLEQITGGRVELGSFQWNLSRLEFEARDLTVHGLEAAGEKPYAQADRLLARLKILSVFQRDVGIRYLKIERPQVHIVVYPDGSTNQPKPRTKREADNKAAVQRLFALEIEQVEVSEGEMVFNHRRYPLDFAAVDVSAGMTYAMLERRYDGNVNVGAMDVSVRGSKPIASNAEVQFSIFEEKIALKSLKWGSSRSRLEASGELTDFNDPRITLTYNADLAAVEVAPVVNMRQLREGRVYLQGTGAFTTRQEELAGKVRVANLEWSEATIRVAGVNAGAEYALTNGDVRLSNIFATALGGTATGSAQIANLFPSNARDRAPQEGTAELKLNNVSVAALTATAVRATAMTKLNLAGSASGTAALAWQGTPRNARIETALAITAPAQPREDQVPVQGDLAAVYHGRTRTIEVRELDLQTRSSTILASGVLGERDAQLKLNVNTRDLRELEPVLASFGFKQSVPLELGGSAIFDGTITGRITSPAVAGNLRISDFHSTVDLRSFTRKPQQASGQLTPAAATRAPRIQRIHWDSLAAEIFYSAEKVSARNGLLKRGRAQIAFSGDASLSKGKLLDSSPFTVRVNIKDGDFADLQQMAGYSYPLEGTLDLALNASGTQQRATGTGEIRLAKAKFYGERIDAVRSDLRFVGPEAQFSNIAIQQNGGTIVGKASYNMDAESFRFDIHGKDFDLTHLESLHFSKVEVKGRADFTAEGSGTFAEPVINADFTFTDLGLNGERAGTLTAHAETRGREMHITARSNFRNAMLMAGGTVQLRDFLNADLRAQFSRFDLSPWIQAYSQGRLTGTSDLEGTIHLVGPLRRPRELAVDASIERFIANIENVPLQSDGPIRFRMRDQVATIEKLRIFGDGTDFTAEGAVNLAGDQRVRLGADGNVNLRLLKTLDPDIQSSGTTIISANMRGTLKDPRMFGTMEIKDGSVAFIDAPNGLSDINGTLAFNETRLAIQSLKARTGGGELTLGGFVSYSRGLNFNLTAKGEQIRLRYPEGVSSMANVDLQFVGTTQKAVLSGDVLVTKFSMNPRFDFALYLARANRPLAPPDPDAMLGKVVLDLHVTSTPELQVQASIAKLSGDVDLRVRGTADDPVLLGRVNITEGNVVFNGTEYHLERGDVVFSNPVRIEPIVNIDATARVRGYDIALGFHGKVSQMTTTYRSDPPLPVPDIIALLALGRTQEEAIVTQQTTTSFTETASNAILSQALNATVSNRVQKLFGVSRIKIDPQIGGPENNPNARLTIEQQVSNNVTLTYITNLAESSQQVIQMEINLNKNVSLVGVRDENGVVGVDVRIRQRKD